MYKIIDYTTLENVSNQQQTKEVSYMLTFQFFFLARKNLVRYFI